jgi:microcompartment protein CcmL/EutN
MMFRLAVAGVLSAFALAMSAPAFATDYRGPTCKNCPKPRPHYDTQEVVRTTKDVDHSRVINTQSVVVVPSGKVHNRNHLVIRKNTVRHIGTVRHNHTIIEKEIRYKRPRVYAPPVVVNFVTQKYYTTHRPALVDDISIYPRRKCCRPLRVRG